MTKNSLFLSFLLCTTLCNNNIFSSELTNQTTSNNIAQDEKAEQKLEQDENAHQWNIADAAIYGVLAIGWLSLVTSRYYTDRIPFWTVTALGIYFYTENKKQQQTAALLKEFKKLKKDSVI